MIRTSIILFAHGSRDRQWAEPSVRIRDHARLAMPEVPIDVAFLQTMQPTLDDAVAKHAASGVLRILIAPLFFGQGGHLKDDLPRLVSQVGAAHPEIELHVTPAAGEVEELVAMIAGWIVGEFRALLERPNVPGRAQTG